MTASTADPATSTTTNTVPPLDGEEGFVVPRTAWPTAKKPSSVTSECTSCPTSESVLRTVDQELPSFEWSVVWW